MKKIKRLRALQNQIRRLNRHLEKLQIESNRFSRLRLSTFIVGIGLGIVVHYLVYPWLGWSIMALTLVIFNLIAFFHRKIERSLTRHKIWLGLKSTQVARMQLDWHNIPFSPAKEPQIDHPFEIDLDITGKRSLHHLLDTAVSRDGSQLLLDWLLLIRPETHIVEQRQTIAKELTPLARFRDKLHLAYRLVSKEQLEGKKLLYFLERQNIPGSFGKVLFASAGLALLNIVLFALHYLGVIPAFWIITVTVYGVIYFMNQGLLDSLLDDSVLISEELKKFRAVLEYLECYRYGENESLKRLCRPFWDEGHRPSVQLRRIVLISVAVGLRMNPVFRFFLNAFLPWDFYLVRLLNQMKNQLSEKLSNWLQILIELEALSSLANFAYLNPGSIFPKILVGENAPSEFVFRAEALGHPLLPSEERRYNDFIFKRLGDVALITGSNMSGKSTFLKTLGINLCLAFAGGPVVAKSLQTRLFRIYTCIQINDSVTDGFSFFYAEVKRLKTLLGEIQTDHEIPLLFLIDEIFKGTNNKERLIGSRSYIQSLIGRHGLGAISTHDLELTQLAHKIPQIINYHFKEDVVDGKMVFDYKMRPGPCPSTNALKIMKMEGLPVEAA